MANAKNKGNWQDSIEISDYGYKITHYKFIGELVYEVELNGQKLPGVFETKLQAEKWCKDKISLNTDYLKNN